MEDGHTSTFLCPRTVTWFLRNALLTSTKPRVISARITSSANQLPRFRSHTSLEVAGVTPQKKKWWRRSWETVQLMATSRLQVCLVSIKRVYLARKVLSIFTNKTLSSFNSPSNLRKAVNNLRKRKPRLKMIRNLKKRKIPRRLIASWVTRH